MKSKTKQKVAKWFAAVVVFVMIFQVLMPFFSTLPQNTVTVNATSSTQTVAPATTIDSVTTPATSAPTPTASK